MTWQWHSIDSCLIDWSYRQQFLYKYPTIFRRLIKPVVLFKKLKWIKTKWFYLFVHVIALYCVLLLLNINNPLPSTIKVRADLETFDIIVLLVTKQLIHILIYLCLRIIWSIFNVDVYCYSLYDSPYYLKCMLSCVKCEFLNLRLITQIWRPRCWIHWCSWRR